MAKLGLFSFDSPFVLGKDNAGSVRVLWGLKFVVLSWLGC